MLKIVVVETLTEKFKYPVIIDVSDCGCCSKSIGEWVVIDPQLNCTHLSHFKTKTDAMKFAKG